MLSNLPFRRYGIGDRGGFVGIPGLLTVSAAGRTPHDDPPPETPRRDRSAPRLTPSVYCSLDSRIRNESGTLSPWTTGSYPTHRAAPRYIDMKRSRSDCEVFRLSPSMVVFTRCREPDSTAS